MGYAMWLTRRFLVGFLAFLAAALPAFGEEPAAAPAPETPQAGPAATEDLTVELVQTRIKQLEEAKELPDEIKAPALELRKKTLTELQAAALAVQRTEKFVASRKQVPEDLKAIRAQLTVDLPDPAAAVDPKVAIAELEQLLSKAEQELFEAEKRFEEAERRMKQRIDKRGEIVQAIAAAKEQSTELENSKPPNKAPEVVAAHGEYVAARRRTLDAEIAAFEQELSLYEAQNELLPLLKDQATRTRTYAQKKVKHLQSELLNRRKREAERQAREAIRDAANAHPAVKMLAENNSALAKKRTGPEGILYKIEQATHYRETLESELAAIRTNFASITEKIKAGGLTNVVGLRLRRQKMELPDVDVHYRKIRERREDLNWTNLELLDAEDQRALFSDIGKRTAEILDSLDPVPPPEEYEEVKAKINELLVGQRDLLQSLIADYITYSEKLAQLDVVEKELIQTVDDYHSFIGEHVLWIRSAAPLSLSETSQIYEALDWILDPDRWLHVAHVATTNEFLPHWAVCCFPIMLALLLALRNRFRSRLNEIGDKAAKGTADAFTPTLQALALTVVLALPFPGFLWLCGWLLTTAAEAAEFPRAVGVALETVAVLYLATELLRHSFRPRGLAVAHFGWPMAPLLELRRRIRWLLMLGLPAVFLVVLTEYQSTESYKSSLGRLAFIFGLVVLSLCLAELLRPSGRVMAPLLGPDSDGRLRKPSRVWYPFAVSVPLFLIVVSALGYHYTALQITWRLKEALWLALTVLFARALLLRWLIVARRKLAMRRWRERRAQQLAAQNDPNAAPAMGSVAQAAEQPNLDLATVHDQTQRLLHTAVTVALIAGLCMIWADVLPALKILDQFVLWDASSVSAVAADAAASSAEGAGAQEAASTQTLPTTAEEAASRKVTLVNLIAALVVTMLALLASKNLPGFLEIAVLQRLPIDNGARYAITTICRYVFTVVSVVFACANLGFSWDKVQWLLAAMSVGLGFGLQEIFANFVSGLIILFERPIRVGDIVTIDEITGVVSRIRMRATTITNWDRKEFVVPNKEFITGRLLNWTLSDQINRIVVNVGVAYGSDTQRVRELLLEVAASHPVVMKDPAPVATFEGFGEHSLNFVLRCYLPNLENRLEVINHLHMTVDRRFRESGIELALPQRGVHIRTLPQNLALADANGAGEAQEEAEDGDRRVSAA